MNERKTMKNENKSFDPILKAVSDLNEVLKCFNLNKNSNNSDRNRNFQSNKDYKQNNFNPNKGFNSLRNKPKIQCFRCRRFGHKQSECRTQMPAKPKATNETNKKNLNANAITETKSVNSSVLSTSYTSESMILIDVEIKNKIYKGLIDCGSEITLMRK